MKRWQNMYDRYKHEVDFVAVYLREMHPVDGWFHPRAKLLRSHQNILNRQQVAKEFLKEHNFNFPLYVDEMTDVALFAFAAEPEKLVIVDKAKIVYISGSPGPFPYDLSVAERWLTRTFSY